MDAWIPPTERRRREEAILAMISARMPELEALLTSISDDRIYEDLCYRFYHQSYKVYALQTSTTDIVSALQALGPDWPLNKWFTQIVAEGTGKAFRPEDNDRWLEVTRPILEAFFHARYFLELVCKYGKRYTNPPETMPGGYAAILYLFNIR